MNLLITQVATDYMDEWISDLLKDLNIEQCVVVYVDRENVKNGKVCNQYATFVIDWGQCAFANYEILQSNKVPPIDNQILTAMAPYEDIILWMLRRRLGREYTRLWRHYCTHIRVWNYLLEYFNIDVYMATFTPHEGYDYVIYALCKIKGIHFCATHLAHFQGYSYLLDDLVSPLSGFEDYIERLRNKYERFPSEAVTLSKEMDVFYKKYYNKNSDLTPWYWKGKLEQEKKSVIVDSKERIESFFKRNGIKGLFRLRTYINVFVVAYRSRHCRRIRIIYNRMKFILWELFHLFSLNEKVYDFITRHTESSNVFREYEILLRYYNDNAHAVDYNKKYIYVALQTQPEAAASPNGGRFVDQILMVQMLSYYLPEGYYLYVKEHPAQIRSERAYSFRTLEFYKNLLKIPKVFLVPLEEDTYRLIRGSCAVASLTGTAGFEAMVSNKLFFMFGYYLSQYAPLAIPIRNTSDCIMAMQQMQAYKQTEDISKKQMKIYFKALEKVIFKGHDIDESAFKMAFPDNYWNETKGNIVNAFRNKLVEFMGRSVLKDDI